MVRVLQKFGVEAADLKEVFRSIGEQVASKARARVPKRSGKLASVIKPTNTKNKAAVRVGSKRVPYAGVIEYGWARKGITARSYLRQAINSEQAQAIKMMEEGLGELIKRLDLDA